MKYSHCVFRLAGLILGGLALTSCGSGGSSDGGTTPLIASPTQTTVSGTVQAPGGGKSLSLQSRVSSTGLLISSSVKVMPR